jgi:glycerol-3-phosphate acyltransferase PlsX
VALLSNGEEAQRGSATVVRAHEELARLGIAARSSADQPPRPFEFLGNVEGDEVPAGTADVVVCDGFTGNIALKLIEGVSGTVLAAIRDAALSSRRSRIGGALMRPSLRAFREAADPEQHGGAYLLGLRHMAVIAHGRFARRGFAQAILRAQDAVQDDLVGRTHAALERAGALKLPPGRERVGAHSGAER